MVKVISVSKGKEETLPGTYKNEVEAQSAITKRLAGLRKPGMKRHTLPSHRIVPA